MLSTPPAFILSQDQTLNKSFFRPDQRYVNLAFTVFVLGICSLKSQKIGLLKAFSLESSGLHCCLLIKVRCVACSCDSLLRIARSGSLVNNFFQEFFLKFLFTFSHENTLSKAICLSDEFDCITVIPECQHLIS